MGVLVPRRWIAALLAIAAIGSVFVFTSNPLPSALLIRAVFQQNAKQTLALMQPYAPSEVSSQLDVAYGSSGNTNTLDVFRPAGATTALPTVVWMHGGAWVSGSKENVRPYVQNIAAAGTTAVAINYTVAPELSYPGALRELDQALAYLLTHAAELGIDPNRVVLAGDSAGANMVSQYAAMVTNPNFAQWVGFTPSLAAAQLRGVVLNCGIFDVSRIPEVTGIVGWGFNNALWAYAGRRDYLESAAGQQMSSVNYVTSNFPATWITGGNADPLTQSQSQPLSEKLQSLKVPLTELFWPSDQTPELPHEYQFHLNLDAARQALASTIAFVKSVTT